MKLRKDFLIILLSVIVIAGGLLIAPVSNAQYWQNLPPYNILWPLWSPALSPADPITGLPTPLVSSVASGTILPLQPALVLNPYNITSPMGDIFPWLLYNTAGGLVFWDQFYGFNSFPPSSWIDPTGAPIPLALATGYSFLPLPSRLAIEY